MKTEKVSTVELSKYFDLTERSVRRLASEQVIPEAMDGQHVLLDAVRAYVKALRKRHDAPSLTKARRSRLEAQAELSQLDLGERRGQLVSVSDMSARLTPMMAAIRQIILSSDLDQDAKDGIFDALGKLLTDALTKPSEPDASGNSALTETPK